MYTEMESIFIFIYDNVGSFQVRIEKKVLPSTFYNAREKTKNCDVERAFFFIPRYMWEWKLFAQEEKKKFDEIFFVLFLRKESKTPSR